AERVLHEIGIATRPVPALSMPDPAHVFARLEDEKRNAALSKVIGGADAGDARADDDGRRFVRRHVELPSGCHGRVMKANASPGRNVMSATPSASTSATETTA